MVHVKFTSSRTRKGNFRWLYRKTVTQLCIYAKRGSIPWHDHCVALTPLSNNRIPTRTVTPFFFKQATWTELRNLTGNYKKEFAKRQARAGTVLFIIRCPAPFTIRLSLSANYDVKGHSMPSGNTFSVLPNKGVWRKLSFWYLRRFGFMLTTQPFDELYFWQIWIILGDLLNIYELENFALFTKCWEYCSERLTQYRITLHDLVLATSQWLESLRTVY